MSKYLEKHAKIYFSENVLILFVISQLCTFDVDLLMCNYIRPIVSQLVYLFIKCRN